MSDHPSRQAAEEIEEGVIRLFTDMVRMAGLPPSIGAIYGLLFVSDQALHMDELVARLDISKGSASQGLRVLRSLGAVETQIPSGERREHYRAGTALKNIVAAFLDSQVRPQLKTGMETTSQLLESLPAIDDESHREFLAERLHRLANWQRRGSQALGLLHRFLD